MAEYAKGKEVSLSKNFVSTEFDCKCKYKSCATTEIDPKLVEYLQKIRDYFGKAVSINSAYRCEKHNKEVGGAKSSKHLFGQAADIKVSGITPRKVAQYAEHIGILGIGLYSNFVHIDTRANKFFWYGSGQEPRTTFGGQDAFDDEPAPAPTTNGGDIVITGSSVNVRKGPSTSFPVLKVAQNGDTFEAVDCDGWRPILVNGEVGWVSEKYSKKQ